MALAVCLRAHPLDATAVLLRRSCGDARDSVPTQVYERTLRRSCAIRYGVLADMLRR